MCLSKLTWPDKLDLQVYQKVSMRHTMQFLPNILSFWLTCHKANQFFKGNHLIIHQSATPNACSFFLSSSLRHPHPHPSWVMALCQWNHPNASMVYCTSLQVLYLIHSWTVNVGRQCHSSCQSRHPSQPHSDCRSLDFWYFQSLHSKKSILIQSPSYWLIFSPFLTLLFWLFLSHPGLAVEHVSLVLDSMPSLLDISSLWNTNINIFFFFPLILSISPSLFLI